MNIMQIYAIIDGKLYKYSDFQNAKEANDAFLRIKENAESLATNNNGKIKFWKGDETDWFIPMVEESIEADDWRTEDTFEFRVLSQWEENALAKRVKVSSSGLEEEWEIYFRGERYHLTAKYCRGDPMFAAAYNGRDKYMEYTFWNENGHDLSTYCIEL